MSCAAEITRNSSTLHRQIAQQMQELQQAIEVEAADRVALAAQQERACAEIERRLSDEVQKQDLSGDLSSELQQLREASVQMATAQINPMQDALHRLESAVDGIRQSIDHESQVRTEVAQNEARARADDIEGLARSFKQELAELRDHVRSSIHKAIFDEVEKKHDALTKLLEGGLAGRDD